MASNSPKLREEGDAVSAPEALLYIEELAISLREIAVELNHEHLANLLGEAATEAGRLATADHI
jgi:hypothetical protein